MSEDLVTIGGGIRPQPTKLLRYENTIPTLPILFLWPHPKCNCRCVMCDIWKKDDKTELTADHLRGWAEDWKKLGIQSVVLTGGEALLHSHIWELCDVLRSMGIMVSILSTGITLHVHAEKVIEHLGAVYVSLDGPKEIHNRVRGVPKAYEKLKNSIETIKKLQPNFPIRARCTVQEWNFRHLRETVRTAKELGVDCIGFTPADISSEAFNRPGGWDEEKKSRVAVSGDSLHALQDELRALERDHAADFASGYILDPPERLQKRVLQYYRAIQGRDEFPQNICNAPWSSALIEYDGTVKPCFFQPAYGNIHEAGSLSAVINSEKALAFRAGLDTTTNPICKKCVCTMAIYGCDCGWSRTPPYCDNTCSVVSEFLM